MVCVTRPTDVEVLVGMGVDVDTKVLIDTDVDVDIEMLVDREVDVDAGVLANADVLVETISGEAGRGTTVAVIVTKTVAVGAQVWPLADDTSPLGLMVISL